MTAIDHTVRDQDARIENLAAELTSAAYPLVLRPGLKHSWIKLELGLWRRLTRTVRKWARKRRAATSLDEVEAVRAGLLGALTGDALAIALNNGSRPEVQSNLSRAFRQVIGRFCHVN